jgi:copper ion binding protein
MKEKLTLGAAAGAALTASLCCLGPLVAAVVGLGSFGAAALFEAWRPYGLGITAVLLGAAFYFTYRKPACADGSCAAPEVSRRRTLVLWIATVVIVLVAAFPYYSGRLWTALGGQAGERSASGAPERLITVRLAIRGMTCGGCAAHVEGALREIPGVRSAAASYEKGEAVVEYDPARVKTGQLIEAVKAAGFTLETMTATIPVEGMTCAGCAAAIREALARHPGVKTVEVSFEKKQARVSFDPARVTLEQVAEVINKMGFKAAL